MVGCDSGARQPGSDPASLCVLEELVVSLIFLNKVNKVEHWEGSLTEHVD